MPSSSTALNLGLWGVPYVGGAGFESPINVSASVSGSSGNWTVELTFTPPEETPDSYTVEVSESNGAFSAVTPDSASGSEPITYTFTSLADGLYQYRIQANYSEGSSAFVFSNFVEAFINMNFDLSSKFHILSVA